MPPSEPLWYCHECHAEMRPLMTPDPICASCHGGFIEKMENPEDDPREFALADDDPFGGGIPPPGLDRFLLGLQALMDRGMTDTTTGTNRGPQPTQGAPTSRLSFQISSSGRGTRTVNFGGPNTLGAPPRRNSAGDVPTASEQVPCRYNLQNTEIFYRFLGPGSSNNGADRITGPMMAQYLFALLGNRDPFISMLGGGMGLGGPEGGRMGDYVFNQEALDQIITQLMENNNAHRPVPATEEIMANLPREVLTEGSPLLEKDCAVCKEQFNYQAEDPDERVVVSLPCKHPFHEPCIMPWLKSSGTCPVCRYALVPQPSDDHSQPQRNQGTPSTSNATPSSSPPQPRPSSPPSTGSNSRERERSGGFIQNILGAFTGHHHHHHQHNSNASGSSQRASTSSSSPHSPHRRSDPGRRENGSRESLPGGWADDLD
ncbi:hypothetical protein NMY22_g6524 [Coprinellus aureogranulatus]|nr:hypothetical protein NMY22_g6524 [Coprinellus aureogranulatus]